MKKIIALIILVFSQSAYSWYCEEVSSEWMEKGKILRSCGIGSGLDENTARLSAYNNARKEFDLICNKDTTCANKVVNIDPQRSVCTPNADGGGVTCHRLFHYYITSEDRKESPPEPKEAPKSPKAEQKTIIYKTEVHNHNQITNVYNSNYITVKEPERAAPRESGNNVGSGAAPAFRSFIRQAGRVTVYSTNSRQYQGVYLTNPSNDEIERAISRGNSGGMGAVYIYNP